MIQFIPLVYFSILTLALFKKRGVDACTYVSLLYVITSFCSVLMFRMGLVEWEKQSPSFFATLIYCMLLSFCIIPLARLKPAHIGLIVTKKCEKFLTKMTYVYFAVFICFLILSVKDIYAIIVNGDFAILRAELLADDVEYGSGGLFRIIIGLFVSISFVMLLVFFISIVYFKKGVWFNLMALLGSSTGLLSDIIGISRSGFFYYTIIIGACFVVFWKRLNHKIKKTLIPVFAVIFLGMGSYFSSVTIDRFAENSSIGGTQGGLVVYSGQPYTNFCYFFDNKPYTGFSTRFLLPFTNYIINGYRGGTQRETEMTKLSKMDSVVFMTFLGSFIMDCNQVMPFVYVAIYILLVNLCIRKKREGNMSLFWLFVTFLLIIVPSIGCITYFFNSPFMNLSLIVLLGIIKIQKL